MAHTVARIPLFIARGSHYEVGLQVGRAFHNQIQYYINHHDWLEKYEVFEKTQEGGKFCKSYWDVWDKQYPQYVEELKGLAEGASVDLLQLKLLHVERELATHLNLYQDVFTEAKGCTDILVANDKHTLIGHNEDWIAKMQGRDILLLAHILSWTSPDGQTFPEERFLVHTWPGILPGMNSGFTKNGMVFSIDHLFPKKVGASKRGDMFTCRHVLTARSLKEAESILSDDGRFTATGFVINTGFRGSKVLNSFEVGPLQDGVKNKALHKTTVEAKTKSCYVHFNNFEQVKDVEAMVLQHCVDRHKTYKSLPACTDVTTLRHALGDDSSNDSPIYQKYQDDRPFSTVASVIFDLRKETMSFFQHNPRDTAPLISLPFSIIDNLCM